MKAERKANNEREDVNTNKKRKKKRIFEWFNSCRW
jgi:hypothetical protein